MYIHIHPLLIQTLNQSPNLTSEKPDYLFLFLSHYPFGLNQTPVPTYLPCLPTYLSTSPTFPTFPTFSHPQSRFQIKSIKSIKSIRSRSRLEEFLPCMELPSNNPPPPPPTPGNSRLYLLTPTPLLPLEQKKKKKKLKVNLRFVGGGWELFLPINKVMIKYGVRGT